MNRQQRYKARYPDRVSDSQQRYQKTPAGREKNLRYQTGHRVEIRIAALNQRALIEGHAPLDMETFRPRPEDGLCTLCRKKKTLCIDHDHITGRFRGWLCRNCNAGLGLLGDTANSLIRAVSYLNGEL